MKRSPTRAFLLVAAVFGLLALIPLWRPVFLGEAFVPAGMQKGIAPWNAGVEHPSVAWEVLRWDGVAQFYPWRKYLFDNLNRGDIPLWNRHELLGTPFLANSQSAVFYPPHWLLAPLGAISAMTLSSFLHLVWAGLGVYVLCRRLRCGFAAAILAGATFELSQWMIAWMQVYSLNMTAAWIPWLLAAIHSAFQQHSTVQPPTTNQPHATDQPHAASSPAAETPTPALPLREGGGSSLTLGARVFRPASGYVAAVRIGVCGGMMLLAGHLQIAVYGFIAAVLLAGHLAFWERRPAALAPVVGGLVLAGMLAAVQFLPAYEMGKLSHRASVPTAEGYEGYVRTAADTFDRMLIVDPYYEGDPSRGWANEPEEAYKGQQPLPEYASYVGLVALALAAYALVRVRVLAPENWFFLALAAFAWLIANGTDLNRLLYFGIPGWSSTGSPARILCLWTLALAVLSAVGLQKLSEDAGQPRKLRWGASAIVIVVLGTVVLCYSGFREIETMSPAVGAAYPHPTWTWLPASAAVWLLTGLFGLGLSRRLLPSVHPALVLILLQVATLFGFAFRFNPSVQASEVYAPFKGIDKLRDASPYRVAVIDGGWGMYGYPRNAVLPPNSALVYGYDEVGGYDSLILKATKEQVLDKLNGGDSAPPENGNMMFVKPQALRNLGLLRSLSVRYVVLPRALAGGLERARLVSATSDVPAIYELDEPRSPLVLVTSPLPPTNWLSRWRGPDSFGVSLPNGPVEKLCVGIVMSPGWHAQMGRESLPVSSGPLPSGAGLGDVWMRALLPTHQGWSTVRPPVIFTYEPATYRVGLFLSLCALSVICAVGVAGLRPGCGRE